MTDREKGLRKRKWIKIYPVECIDGSIRYQLEPDERSVWYDLLNFAAICGNEGVISDRDGRAFPLTFIANRLNIGLELLERAIGKCKEEGRIVEKGGVIKITHWKDYQSAYDYQKKYQERYRQESCSGRKIKQ